MKKSKVVSKLLIYIVCIFFSLIFILPVIWVVLSSFKTGSELFAWPPTIFPHDFTINNYITAFQKGNFGLYFWNSLYVTVIATILTIVVNSMAGYAFAKYEFKGRDTLFVIFLATLIIPLEVIMVPTFQVLKTVGLYNSLWGVIIPPAATPTGVFLLRQYFLSVPNELLEASRIDGAGEARIFVTIMLPIAKPVIAVLTIFSFMWRWNDYLWPLLVISDDKLYTVQLAISNFIGQYSVDWSSLLAMTVVSMIPVLIVFLVFQKQFVKGMVVSGMKE